MPSSCTSSRMQSKVLRLRWARNFSEEEKAMDSIPAALSSLAMDRQRLGSSSTMATDMGDVTLIEGQYLRGAIQMGATALLGRWMGDEPGISADGNPVRGSRSKGV